MLAGSRAGPIRLRWLTNPGTVAGGLILELIARSQPLRIEGFTGVGAPGGLGLAQTVGHGRGP